MESFSEVSLGFAEFVSQLLRETFDATVSAQNYQNEQYAQLENLLKLSTENFRKLYITDELITDRMNEMFGKELFWKVSVDDTVVTLLNNLFPNQKSVIYNKKITKVGATIINVYIIDMLVEEKKNTFNYLLNDSGKMRLMVESGEIRVKLDLTNFSENLSKNIQSQRKTKDKENKKMISRLVNFDGVKIREVNNTSDNTKTLLVDKESIKINHSAILPVRIVAKPVNSTSTSNLHSEVIIKFKTI